METMGSILEKHKNWVESYAPLDNAFIAKRFKEGGQAILGTVGELGSLMSSYFQDKEPLDICTFELTVRNDGSLLVAFKSINSEGFVNGFAQSIPASIFVKAMELTNKDVPVKYEVNGMGFAWRADKVRIIEALEIIALLEDAKQDG
jgi:hypothetical protein